MLGGWTRPPAQLQLAVGLGLGQSQIAAPTGDLDHENFVGRFDGYDHGFDLLADLFDGQRGGLTVLGGRELVHPTIAAHNRAAEALKLHRPMKPLVVTRGSGVEFDADNKVGHDRPPVFWVSTRSTWRPPQAVQTGQRSPRADIHWKATVRKGDRTASGRTRPPATSCSSSSSIWGGVYFLGRI